VKDQLQPVESSVKVGDTVTINGIRYTLAGTGETMEKDADRRTIKREEREDGEGITRSEEIIEEVGDDVSPAPQAEAEEAPAEEAPEPVAEGEDDSEAEESKEEEPQAVAASVSEEGKLFAALEVAELAVELGLIEASNKLAFVAQLEEESVDAIEARKTTLSDVKEAGLSKKSASRLAGVRRVPRLSHTVVPSDNGSGSLENIPDEAIYSS